MSRNGNEGRGKKRPSDRDDEGEEPDRKKLHGLQIMLDAIEIHMAEDMAAEESEHTSTLSEEEQLEYRKIILKKASGAWGFLLSDDVNEIVDDIEEAFKKLPNEEAKWMGKTFDDFDAGIKEKGGLVKFKGLSKIFKRGTKDEYMSKWEDGLAEFDVFGDRLRDEINQRTVSFKEGYKGLDVVAMAHIIQYLANRDPDIRDVTSKIEELAIFWLPSMLETRRSAISMFVQKMKDKALAFEILASLTNDQRRGIESFANVENVVTFVRASNQLKKELEEGKVVFGRREFRIALAKGTSVLDPSRPAPAYALPQEVVELITSYASRINRVRSPVYIPVSHPTGSTDSVLRYFVEKMMESLERNGNERATGRYDWIYRLSWASSIKGKSPVFGNVAWNYLNSKVRWPQSILNDTLDENIGRAITTAESSLRFLKETEMRNIEKKIMHSRFRAAITAEKVHIHSERAVLIGDPGGITPTPVSIRKIDTKTIRHHAISWAFRYFVTTFLRKVNDDMVGSPTYQEDFDGYMNKTMTVGTFDNLCLSIWELIGRSPDPMRGADLKEDYQRVYIRGSKFWKDSTTNTWWVESDNLPSRADYLKEFKDEKYKGHLEEVARKLTMFETAFDSRLIRIETALEIIDRIEREMDRLVMGRLPQNPPRSGSPLPVPTTWKKGRREEEIRLDKYNPSEAKHRAYAKLVRLKRKSNYVEIVPVQSMKALTIKEDFDLLF